MNDFREYQGVDFSQEFLAHYGKGHLQGGHSGRYPWGSTNNVKGGSTDKKKQNASDIDPRDEKRTVKKLKKTINQSTNTLNYTVQQMQRYKQTAEKALNEALLNSPDGSKKEANQWAIYNTYLAMYEDADANYKQALQNIKDAFYNADVMGYKVVSRKILAGINLVKKEPGDEDVVKYSVRTDTGEVYNPDDVESVKAFRRHIIESTLKKK